MNRDISRRELLQQGTRLALAAGVSGACSFPTAAAEPILEYRRGGMLYRRLGATDLFLSALSFGSHINPSHRIGAKHGSMLDEKGQARRDRHISKAIDYGVNMVDTYENAGQWKPMAQLVRARREKTLVSICRQFPNFVGKNIDDAARPVWSCGSVPHLRRGWFRYDRYDPGGLGHDAEGKASWQGKGHRYLNT